jgi:hypothetical protein
LLIFMIYTRHMRCFTMTSSLHNLKKAWIFKCSE